MIVTVYDDVAEVSEQAWDYLRARTRTTFPGISSSWPRTHDWNAPMKLPFRRKQTPPQVEVIAEPKVSWHFNTILESQRFVKVAARDMIERRIRRVKLENAEIATADLRAAVEAGDELALHGALRKLMDVGVVMNAADVERKKREE